MIAIRLIPRYANSTRRKMLSGVGFLFVVLCIHSTVLHAALRPPLMRDSTLAIPPLRVLFIGNSYTFYNDMPQQLRQLALSGGELRVAQVERVVVGGRNLKQHWEDTVARAAISKGHWDYIVLQEHSLGAIQAPDTMRKYMRLFDAEVHKVGAQTILYMTWARQLKPESQREITRMYTSIGKELGALVVPVGLAWEQVQRTYPALVLFDPDGSHPNAKGSYLAACVFYSLLYVKAPLGLVNTICIERDSAPFTIATLVYDEAMILQRIAWEAYLQYKYSQ